LGSHMFMVGCSNELIRFRLDGDRRTDLWCADYPWAELGKATVVDVGGGVGESLLSLSHRSNISTLRKIIQRILADRHKGSFCIQLSAIYPDLSFVIQDKDEFLRQGKEEVWPALAPAALAAGRVSFQTHDFFKPNIVQGADVYWLRYIMYFPTLTSPSKKMMG